MSDQPPIEPITVRAVAPPVIKNTKIRILWYSDFLRPTGFGNVAEAIISRLQKTGKYQFEVLGINYKGVPYNLKGSPYYHLRDIPVWPASRDDNDVFGYSQLAQMMATRPFDIFFSLQDAFNLMPVKDLLDEAKARRKFRYVFYFPVDGDIKDDWVKDGVQMADFPVTYTEFGRKKVKEINPALDVQVIPHGADMETFKPFATPEERKAFRKNFMDLKDDDEFLITNINRNQPRKDLPRCIQAFGKFCELYPHIKAKLYLHCHPLDPSGHKIQEFCKKYLPTDILERVILPNPDGMKQEGGIPIEVISQIYAASDLVTSTTLGEGWGLSTTEAMACKTPVVMPDNSATTEIIGENNERGYLVNSGGHPNLYKVMRHDHELLRPLTDIDELVSAWKEVYDKPDEAKAKAEKAYTWLQEKTWDKIAQQWDELFTKVYESMS